MDIFEILKAHEIEVPEDKKEALNTELRKAYKHNTEVDKITEKFNTERTAFNEQLKNANAEIESYKGMDIDGIKKSADEWKEKAEKSQKEFDEKIADMEYDNALRDELLKESFSSDYARTGIQSEIKAKNLPIIDGKIIGLPELLETYKKDKPDAFKTVEAPPPNLKGAGMNNGGKPPEITTETLKTMGYEERLKLKTENPAQYKALGGQ